eukprot:1853584-Lingulodinium_polyedra.AAC.1
MIADGKWSSAAVCDFQDFHTMYRWSAGWHHRAPVILQSLRDRFAAPAHRALSPAELSEVNAHSPE